MASGVYGTVAPSFITADDVEIFYHYRPSRASDDPNFQNFKQMTDGEVNSVFTPFQVDYTGTAPTDTTLPGIYNLKLPLSIFGKKGVYCVYIRPKEILGGIVDVGSLAAYPNIKGIVIDSTKFGVDQSLFNDGNLIGWRVNYFDSQRQEMFRIITSNNKCEPVVQNLQDSNQKSVRYRFNANSNLSFLTVSPSSATSYKSNSIPFIGKTGQEISISNTKFNPVMIEIEMIEHDFETISYSIEGSQVRNLDTSLLTTHNFNNEIYAQHELYTLKSEYTGKPYIDVKEVKTDIDFTQQIDQITGNL